MSIEDVLDFLLEFKRAATSGSGVDIVPRAETRPTLANLGLTMGSLWIFGREIEGHEVYIKLKVAQVGDRRIAKCISFHIAKYPLEYPHR